MSMFGAPAPKPATYPLVTFTARCDRCPSDATWIGEPTPAGGGTTYRIVCPACEASAETEAA